MAVINRRIFRKPIRADVTTVDSIVKACIGLHNYLLCTDTARYTPNGFADSHCDGGIREGNWRTITTNDANPALGNIRRIATRNYNSIPKI